MSTSKSNIGNNFDFNIITVNIRGLRSSKKRKVFELVA